METSSESNDDRQGRTPENDVALNVPNCGVGRVSYVELCFLSIFRSPPRSPIVARDELTEGGGGDGRGHTRST